MQSSHDFICETDQNKQTLAEAAGNMLIRMSSLSANAKFLTLKLRGDRVSSTVALKLWDDLPLHIRQSTSVLVFIRCLVIYCYCVCYCHVCAV